ncbi:hypothetical protein HPB52_004411 [Rhipicephalus sanguineus]|uniref:Uncharacterized protein n=1 Tax=Rhipicephalus sanguineus TaxID=34632 RepID=A0A9D4PQS9_RHISA|nr:hypothetical protein HPB52_004411 [Rhipicephalus sanguineus]
MSCRQGPNTASKHERLMDELVQRLVSMSDAHDSKDAVPANPQQTDLGAGGEPGTTVTFAEEELSKQECLRGQAVTHLFPANEEFSPRLSADERRRSVHETLAHVRETLLEVLQDSPRAVTTGATATSTSGIFETMFPTRSDDASLPPLAADSKTASSSLQAPAAAPAAADLTMESISDQTTMESMQENVNPRVETRRYIVSDELCAIYEHIESRWAEVCAKLQADLNGRYDQFLADCRCCLEGEPGECERDQLRHEMADARRELIAEMKEVFRSTCEQFDDWRMRYLEREAPVVLLGAARGRPLPCVGRRPATGVELANLLQRLLRDAALLRKRSTESSDGQLDAIPPGFVGARGRRHDVILEPPPGFVGARGKRGSSVPLFLADLSDTAADPPRSQIDRPLGSQ